LTEITLKQINCYLEFFAKLIGTSLVEKPPRNSVRFWGGGQGLSWAVEPGGGRRRRRRRRRSLLQHTEMVGPIRVKFDLPALVI
jgi:hypothetical protein